MEAVVGRKWENLEMDCLVNIFGRLGIEEMTLAAPFVCRSWYRASTNPLCWKVLDLRPVNLSCWRRNNDFVIKFMKQYRLTSFSFTEFLKFVVRRGGGSATVLLFPLEDVMLEDITYVADQCPALKVLGLPNEDLLDDNPFRPDLIRKWKDLEFLHLQRTPPTIMEILTEISNHCKNFVGLRTSGVVDEELASAIVKLLPKIRYLILNMSTLSKQNLILILDGCKELHTLYIKNCKGLEVDDEILEKASHIRTFNYEGTQLYDSDDDDYGPLGSHDVYDVDSDGNFEL